MIGFAYDILLREVLMIVLAYDILLREVLMIVICFMINYFGKC